MRSTRASGEISTGWPVTKVGAISVCSAVASNSSSMILPEPHRGAHDTPCSAASARSCSTGCDGCTATPMASCDEVDHACPAPRLGEIDRLATSPGPCTVTTDVPVASIAAWVMSASVISIISL